MRLGPPSKPAARRRPRIESCALDQSAEPEPVRLRHRGQGLHAGASLRWISIRADVTAALKFDN
jgi:hypothetical protein